MCTTVVTLTPEQLFGVRGDTIDGQLREDSEPWRGVMPTQFPERLPHPYSDEFRVSA